MTLFLSTFTNKIDKKGRISIPAQFRAALSKQEFPGVVLYESFIHNAIEGCGMSRIQHLSDSIDNLDPFSHTRDAFAATILGSAIQLAFDNDGRIVLPEKLITAINIKDKAIFIGKGVTFEIWNPEEFLEYISRSKEEAKKNRNILTLNKNNV